MFIQKRKLSSRDFYQVANYVLYQVVLLYDIQDLRYLGIVWISDNATQ